MKQYKLFIVCVIYNEKINHINSFAEIKSVMSLDSNVSLLIMDNSTNHAIEEFNSAYELPSNVSYFDNGGNVGLPVAYNNAIRYVKSLENEDDTRIFLMFIDDDTHFSSEYFENILEAIRTREDIEMLSGVVHSGKRVISPLYRRKVFSFVEKAMDKPGYYNNINVINSGWTIKLSLLEAVGGYDERMFLDMVDFCMMDKLHENSYGDILIVDGQISQNFSGSQISNIDAVMKRYDIYMHDLKTYCDITHKPRYYRNIMILRRKTAISLIRIFDKIKGK